MENVEVTTGTWLPTIVARRIVCMFKRSHVGLYRMRRPNVTFNWQAGARLFGFIGAGATLGQLVGSLLAVGLARLGPG